LNDIYTSNIALSYEYDGVLHNNILATVTGETSITVNGNVYAQTLNDSKKVVVTKSEGVEKTLKINVADGVNAVNLVDVNGKDTAVDMDNYTRTAELETLGFTVSQSYKKRYADTNYEQAATIANTERGIFYANVTAEKDGETYTYSTTIDVYNSTEPVEYESFRFEDSVYAVKAYYYLGTGNNTATYDGLAKTYSQELGKGMPMSIGDGYFSTVDFSTSDMSNSSVKNAYGDLAASLTGMRYLALDQSKITPEGPLTAEGFTYGDTNASLNIYIRPRHTKEYYAKFAETDTTSLLKYSYAAGWTKSQSKVWGLVSLNASGEGAYGYRDCWSAGWQATFSKYDNRNITLSVIVDNYDKLNSWQIAMYRVQSPHGKSATELNNGTGKLGALLF